MPAAASTVALVQSVLRPDHNLLEHPISALAAGPSGWVQDVNFLVFGVAHDLIRYRASSRSARDSMAGPAFLALNGIGPMWGGFFPMRFADAYGNSFVERLRSRVLLTAATLGLSI
jgi:hypothetical protein